MRCERLQSLTKGTLLLAVLAIMAGCLQTGKESVPAGTTTGPTAGIPDDDIGLSKSDIMEIPDPILFHVEAGDPGDVPLPDRAYPGAPPVVNHTSEDMLPITLSDNECIACHEVEAKEPGEPTPIPEDHYVDLRNDPGSVQDTVAGARNNCTACHVFQSDAPPLVSLDKGLSGLP